MYIPYHVPKGYWRRFKERTWRLFGKKVPRSYREELLKRVGYCHGAIRFNRRGRELNRIFKEVYSDHIPELIYSKPKLLDIICK